MRKANHPDFLETVMMWIIAVLIALILNSCASIPSLDTSKNPNAIYMYDLSVKLGEQTFSGVGVVKAQAAWPITLQIESRSDVDLFTIQSCHREFSIESAIKTNWIHPKRSYSYQYSPAVGIEDVGSCLLRIGSYNKGQGQSAWAVIDFETPEASLPVVSRCNGAVDTTNGVSICQSKAGLIQELTFPVPVRQAQNSDFRCQFKSDATGTLWRYAMPQGECVAAFQELDGAHRIHRHTSIGFTDILIRGE